MKSYTSLLGTFFVYTLALCMPIFKKKSSLKRLGKSCKLFIVVTLLQWKVCNFFPDVSGEIFSWKLAFKEPRYIRKTHQTWKYMTSSLACPDLHLLSKSLKCFIYRVVTFMQPCVTYRCQHLMRVVLITDKLKGPPMTSITWGFVST